LKTVKRTVWSKNPDQQLIAFHASQVYVRSANTPVLALNYATSINASNFKFVFDSRSTKTGFLSALLDSSFMAAFSC
jgi:hypothetical protein